MTTERDPDLQEFFDAADRVGPDGVRALIDKLQIYRRSARAISQHTDAMLTNIEMVSNVAMLRSKLESINMAVQQWQWEMDLDGVEVRYFLK